MFLCEWVRAPSRAQQNVKLCVGVWLSNCVCVCVCISSAQLVFFCFFLGFFTRASQWRSVCGSWAAQPAGRGRPGRWCQGWAGRCLSRARCATVSTLWRSESKGRGPPGGRRSPPAPTLWPAGANKYQEDTELISFSGFVYWSQSDRVGTFKVLRRARTRCSRSLSRGSLTLWVKQRRSSCRLQGLGSPRGVTLACSRAR